ncbi:hypothetical protein EVAR_7450_1 [Eumeta japonica]|uniref:Uncharacterized protein n=1 Tax=Eumeta variegata TaxID=151549 RepID=A0A4C1V7V0_EUMVA|nr:hypothetical protein EVAR_7450_1 [Eumeta japonica]
MIHRRGKGQVAESAPPAPRPARPRRQIAIADDVRRISAPTNVYLTRYSRPPSRAPVPRGERAVRYAPSAREHDGGLAPAHAFVRWIPQLTGKPPAGSGVDLTPVKDTDNTP